jgi:hypothetical protein
MANHGLKAIFILDYGNSAYGNGTPISDTARAAYLEFVRQATLFAKGRNVLAFEVWNEPDNSTFWSGGDAATYGSLLSAAKAVIQANDPSRKILNGGISYMNMPYALALANTGSLSGLSGIAVHPYRDRYGPESVAANVSTLRTVLATSNGIMTPIWFTEWGYTSADYLDTSIYGDGHDTRARAWQAKMTLRLLLTELSLNLPLVDIHELSDNGTSATDGEQNFGLLTQNLAAKPSYRALSLLNSTITGRSYQGLVQNVPPNVHAMKWKGSSDSVYAVWVDGGSGTLTLNVPSTAQVTKWDGSTPSTTRKLHARM